MSWQPASRDWHRGYKAGLKVAQKRTLERCEQARQIERHISRAEITKARIRGHLEAAALFGALFLCGVVWP